MRIRQFAASAALGVAALGLSACAQTLRHQVSRYQAMPAPQGQTFFVVPGGGMAANGGLEFQRYAGIVAQQLQARGYAPAASPQNANMVVQLGYGVDRGQVRIVEDPFYGSRYGSPFGCGRGFYRPRFGWGSAGGYFVGLERSVLVWRRRSTATSNITARSTSTSAQAAPTQPLFDGRAQARSETNRLDVVIPSLVEAMFTGFPGRSGETVKITIPTPAGHDASALLIGRNKERPAGDYPAGLFSIAAVSRASAFELPRQQADVGVELGVARAQLLDLADGVDHRRVVAAAEAAADVGQRLGRQLLRQIHRHLARPGDFAGAAGRGHLGLADPVMLGDLGLDLVDRNPALVGAQDVGQHFLDERDVDRPPGHHRISADAVERAFELADRRGHPPGKEVDHRPRHVDARKRLELGAR